MVIRFPDCQMLFHDFGCERHGRKRDPPQIFEKHAPFSLAHGLSRHVEADIAAGILLIKRLIVDGFFLWIVTDDVLNTQRAWGRGFGRPGIRNHFRVTKTVPDP